MKCRALIPFASLGLALVAFYKAGAADPPATRPTTRPAAEQIDRPPPRTRAEVGAVLGKAAAEPITAQPRPLHVVLVAGKKDHGPGEHDYPQWQKQWETLLAKAPGVCVSTAFGRPDQSAWDAADLMVFYCWGPQFWDAAAYKQLDAYLARRGGLAVLHSAVISDADRQGLADRIGFAWASGKETKYRHGPHDLTFAKTDDPLTRGFAALHVVDEDYWPVLARGEGVTVLATTPDDGGDWPMLWTRQAGRGRVFCTTLGHYLWTFDDPLVRALMLRGMAWAAGEPVERFRALVTEGVELR